MDLVQNYSFHDSTIEEIFMRSNELLVTVRLWNEQILKLSFLDCRKVKFTFLQEIDTFSTSKESALFNEAIADASNDDEPAPNNFSSYSFIGAWNQTPILEIIASDLKVVTDK